MYSYITCLCRAHVHAAVLNNRNVFLFFCFFCFCFCVDFLQCGLPGRILRCWPLCKYTHWGLLDPIPWQASLFFLFLWFGLVFFPFNLFNLYFLFPCGYIYIYIYIFKNASMLLCHCACPWVQKLSLWVSWSLQGSVYWTYSFPFPIPTDVLWIINLLVRWSAGLKSFTIVVSFAYINNRTSLALNLKPALSLFCFSSHFTSLFRSLELWFM